MIHGVLVAVWLSLAACGGSASELDPGGAALAEPWKAMNLPVAAGIPEVTRDGGLHVAYPGGTGGGGAKQLEVWRGALQKAGWKETSEPYRVMRFLVVDLSGEVPSSQGGQPERRALQLMVHEAGDRVDVQLEFD